MLAGGQRPLRGHIGPTEGAALYWVQLASPPWKVMCDPAVQRVGHLDMDACDEWIMKSGESSFFVSSDRSLM